jgi:Uma2 family endonuclease
LFEILSPSTANYDKGTKFELYRDIESLKEYVLINSTKMHVEHYQRNTEQSWTLTEYKSLEDGFELKTISKPMILGEIYEGISFR